MTLIRAAAPVIERTRDSAHGDFATNAALQLAKAAKRKPRELAQAIVAALPASDIVSKVEIAGPGFINFYLSPAAYHAELLRIADAGAAYGRSQLGGGRRVIVEFVSANPTGPLHVGHGRGAAFGATVANLLDATGHTVHREYYINDHGRQMEILAASVWLRYLERCGERFDFPSNGYRGDYLLPIADELLKAHGQSLKRPAGDVFRSLPPDAPAGDKDEYIDAVIARSKEMLGADGWSAVFELGLKDILTDIRDDLEAFGVHYDRWFSERSLSEEGAIDRALDLLRKNGVVYEKDGARVVPRDRFRRREGPGGRAVERRANLFCLRHRLSPQQARAGLRAAGRHPGRRSSRLPGTRARGSRRDGAAGGQSRGPAPAVRDAVSRRREGADVDTLRATSSRCASCATKSATTRRASST